MKKLLLLFLPFIFVSCGFEIVDEGYVGIKKNLGKVEMEEYQPGFHLYTPIVNSIFEMEVREHKFIDKTVGYTKDLQNVEVSFAVNIRPDPKNMAEFYSEYGEDYINKLVPQVLQSTIKEEVAKYEASPLVENRQTFADNIRNSVREELATKHLDVRDFNITDLDFNDAFEQAIERKVIAKERAIEEENKTKQVKEQATQTITMAEAEATYYSKL